MAASTTIRQRRSGYLGRSVRPRLECLEDRCTPTLYAYSSVVNTTSVAFKPEAVVSVVSENDHSVIVWSQPAFAGRHDIRAQLYNPDRTKLGPEIAVAVSALDEYDPAVSMDASGNFVVTWTVKQSNGNLNVRSAMYSNTAAKIGPTQTIAATIMNEHESSVACTGDGRFVVTYTYESESGGLPTSGVLARQYSSIGVYDSYLYVIVATTSLASNSSVARTSDGRFAVTYEVGGDVYLKRYNSAGTTFLIHAIATQAVAEREPDVAMDNAGNCVVVWQTHTGNAGVSRSTEVLARKVTLAGVLGMPISVVKIDYAAPPMGAVLWRLTTPKVAMSRMDGKFVVSVDETGYLSGLPGDVSFTRYNVVEFTSGGTRRGDYKVDALTLTASLEAVDIHTRPSVSMFNGGLYSVAFAGYSPSSYAGINPALDVTPSIRRRIGRVF